MRTQIKRFDVSELPDVPTKLVDQLNRAVASLSRVREEAYRELAVAAKPTVADTFPLVVAHGLTSVPLGFEVVFARDDTNGSAFTTGVFATWVPDSTGANVIIQSLTGLTAGHAYFFRFRVSA